VPVNIRGKSRIPRLEYDVGAGDEAGGMAR